MDIRLTRGCVCDFLGIDGIKEIDMTDEQRLQYLKEIIEKLPTIGIWFNQFLEFVAETFGHYECSEESCECCGDFVETYKLNL